MKNSDKHTDDKLLENTISARIKEIAVEYGLQSPLTQEEVALFEKQYASEIHKLNLTPPSLKDILSLAKTINASDKSVVIDQTSEAVDNRYAMAARNGREIKPEIEDRMEEALRKMKSEKKTDE